MSLNTLGLLFDLIGAITLFFCALPQRENPYVMVLESAPDEETERRGRRRRTAVAYVGLSFLTAGFALQFIASMLPKP